MLIHLGLHGACKPQTQAVPIEIQQANERGCRSLVRPPHAITRDDLRSSIHEVRTERHKYGGREDLRPIGLLIGHGSEQQVRDEDRDDSDSQNPLRRETWDQPASEDRAKHPEDAKRRPANAEVQDGPVPHLLLPGNHVPEQRAEGHEAEEGNDDEEEEGWRCPGVERHEGDFGVFVLV